MGTVLDTLLINLLNQKQISAAEVARRAKTTPNKISNWRQGKGRMPDKQAIALSAELGVTPFDIKPDFAKVILDGIPDLDRREEMRLSMKRAFKDKVTMLAAPVQAAPNHAPQTDTLPTRKVSRNKRTK